MLKDKNFLNIAYEIATGSKCVSRHTWAIIVKDNRILSTGYNWTPAWYTNCKDFWNWEKNEKHHDWSYKYEIHAEMNAIVWAARNWIKIENATIYSTYEPCFDCTRAIIAAWLKKIVFKEKYKHHKWTELLDFLKATWVEIEQIKD
jgi:dCMP deaminase